MSDSILKILHTNDLHGTLNRDRFDALLKLREGVDLYFDSGDAIKTGNLGVPLKPEPVWPLLYKLRCTASTLGNRETHLLEGAFLAKLKGSKHPIICSNLRRKTGELVFPDRLTLNSKGLKVGVLAVMVPMVTERMASKAASAYLWDPPIPAATKVANVLRPECDLLICITHIGHRQDVALAEACPELDIIFGGHSHTVLTVPVRVGNTTICQGGSHSRFAGVYEWRKGQGLTGGLVEI